MSFNKATLAQYKKVNAFAIAQLQANMELIEELEEELASKQKQVDDGTKTVQDFICDDGDGIGCDMDCVNGWDLHSNYLKVATAFTTLYSLTDEEEIAEELEWVTEQLAK